MENIFDESKLSLNNNLDIFKESELSKNLSLIDSIQLSHYREKRFIDKINNLTNWGSIVDDIIQNYQGWYYQSYKIHKILTLMDSKFLEFPFIKFLIRNKLLYADEYNGTYYNYPLNKFNDDKTTINSFREMIIYLMKMECGIDYNKFLYYYHNENERYLKIKNYHTTSYFQLLDQTKFIEYYNILVFLPKNHVKSLF